MSVTIVNDYFFKPTGNVLDGKEAARELIKYFTEEVPEIQLSLWLESKENPLHHYHITVFDNEDIVETVINSPAIKKFVDRLFPHIDQSTYTSPLCNVWLLDGKGVKKVTYNTVATD